jgi:hypothetical protein
MTNEYNYNSESDHINQFNEIVESISKFSKSKISEGHKWDIQVGGQTLNHTVEVTKALMESFEKMNSSDKTEHNKRFQESLSYLKNSTQIIKNDDDKNLKSAQEKLGRVMGHLMRLNEGVSKGAKPMAELYHPELIDKQNRYGRQGAELFNVWLKQDKGKMNYMNYNDWLKALENGENVLGKSEIPAQYLVNGKLNPAISKVRYLNPEERKAFEVSMSHGKLQFSQSRNVVDTSGKEFIFVVDSNRKMYLGEYSRGTFNHSSFLSGGAVMGAGELSVKDGKIVGITDKSGHYEPDNDLIIKGLMALHLSKVDLSNVVLTINAHPLSQIPKKQYNALEFLRNGGPPKGLQETTKTSVPTRDSSTPASYRMQPKTEMKSRADAEKYLSDKPNGTWFIRFSESQNQDVISIKNKNGMVTHWLTNQSHQSEYPDLVKEMWKKEML